MRRMILLISMLALALLVLIGCGDQYPPPQLIYCSLNQDGSGFRTNYSLKVAQHGRAFYISDDLIFYLGNRLVKRGLFTDATALSPLGMTITDTQYLAIDETRERLYFAADNAICRVDFSGGNFSRLSPNDRAVYRAPALSSCGNYLTAIKDGQITRMEIQSGEWTVLESPQTAYYAVYIGETGEYYFYSLYNDGYYKPAALCKLTATQDSTLLMTTPDPYITDSYFNPRVSSDYRYFAMHYSAEPVEEIGMFGSTYHRYSFPLNIYDRSALEQITVQSCYSYSFVPSSDTILYSHYKYAMADLMRMDLPTRNSSLIWDGYVANNFYSYSVSEIYPRSDGQVLFLKAWKRDRRPIYGDKSSTAPRPGKSVPVNSPESER